jgi:adenylosuccinate lyase
MSVYAGDSALFRDQFGTVEMREVFDDRMTVQKWLDTEVALARAEAELGVIPQSAAEEIAAAGNAADYDLTALKAEMDRTQHPIVPLVRAMETKCSAEAGGYIHWGATTQDIMDTGQVLQIKDAWNLVTADLDALEDNLVSLARTHRDTPMAGRTHGQQAQPITFGYKVAVWISEIRRHWTRIHECTKRLYMGQFSGAVGSMAALGSKGPEVQARMMEILELSAPPISWHVSRDTMAEATSVMAMVAGTMGKIAHEIFIMSRTEFAELEEPMPAGKVGSSTMPHKRNPAICESVVALARTARGCLPPAFENLVSESERDKFANHVEREFMARLHLHTHAAVKKMVVCTGGLTVKADNMRRNLDITDGLMLSEAVMMKLAPVFGRLEAHEILYQAAQQAAVDGRTMKDALMALPEVTDKLSEAEIDAALDPVAYTGLCAAFVDKVLGD